MLLEGPEFVEFSLPVAALQSGAGPYEIRDNRRVSTLERGTFDAESLAELEGLTAVRGGGAAISRTRSAIAPCAWPRPLKALRPWGTSTRLGWRASMKKPSAPLRIS